ncbi:MAG: hypothetical protein LBK91_00090 [Synergistaceae bacterium]|nr:hypothetical protein [Synergistaceae bacterium]
MDKLLLYNLVLSRIDSHSLSLVYGEGTTEFSLYYDSVNGVFYPVRN